eukprot:TRINITY_DN14960_c0_g1_i1.p2 TRINITY_DN14960_c0_g1~~TRINITY_DN14960_c0_g1_i1.p2  ORF type:complete len:117 (+),score=1.29 TRINITY_DN14960_c0_g1_i1:47-397(+)
MQGYMKGGGIECRPRSSCAIYIFWGYTNICIEYYGVNSPPSTPQCQQLNKFVILQVYDVGSYDSFIITEFSSRSEFHLLFILRGYQRYNFALQENLVEYYYKILQYVSNNDLISRD